MNTVQNGKGDKARNNWGQKWWTAYDQINWHRKPERDETSSATQTNGLRASRTNSAKPATTEGI